MLNKLYCKNCFCTNVPLFSNPIAFVWVQWSCSSYEHTFMHSCMRYIGVSQCKWRTHIEVFVSYPSSAELWGIMYSSPSNAAILDCQSANTQQFFVTQIPWWCSSCEHTWRFLHIMHSIVVILSIGRSANVKHTWKKKLLRRSFVLCLEAFTVRTDWHHYAAVLIAIAILKDAVQTMNATQRFYAWRRSSY